jgi:hypothetical protein
VPQTSLRSSQGRPDRLSRPLLSALLLTVVLAPPQTAHAQGRRGWQLGAPIVTYWGGPNLTDRSAQQIADGGWNLAWCTTADLDLALHFGLRCQLRDSLLTPESLDDGDRREALRLLVRKVMHHPAMYSYFLSDEPSATQFASLARIVHFLRDEDSLHTSYINLLPIYATNAQLGIEGGTTPAYREYLRRFVEEVGPELISYDHYSLLLHENRSDYFLNLALVREQARIADRPFMQIIQASSWDTRHRVPNAAELRWLVSTSLAYGAKGISYYVYTYKNHVGGAADESGRPTPLYAALNAINREFTALATELQDLESTGVAHVDTSSKQPVILPCGAVTSGGRESWTDGLLVGCFSPTSVGNGATYALIVNLDTTAPRQIEIATAGRIAMFSPTDLRWTDPAGGVTSIQVAAGEARLVRVRQEPS